MLLAQLGQLLNGGMREKGCVSQTFELSDEDFSATYESFCQRVSTKPNKDE